MNADERRWELERLETMGWVADEEPCTRQLLVARAIDPCAWSAGAQGQIDWCKRSGQLNSHSHFGAQSMVQRKLSLIRARIVLRDLERHEAGLPELPTLDARELARRLEKLAFEMYCAAKPRYHVHHEPAHEIFFLKAVDGIAAPTESIAPDGSVVLEWSEDGRTARLEIATDKRMELTLRPSDEEGIPLSFHGYKSKAPRLLTAAVEWVHHNGAIPETSQDKEEADEDRAKPELVSDG